MQQHFLNFYIAHLIPVLGAIELFNIGLFSYEIEILVFAFAINKKIFLHLSSGTGHFMVN